jgi:hypothetical protein
MNMVAHADNFPSSLAGLVNEQLQLKLSAGKPPAFLNPNAAHARGNDAFYGRYM